MTVELLTEVLGPAAPWQPTVVVDDASGGLVLARKAANDLNVHVGHTRDLEHPRATPTGLRTVTTPVRVAGLHPDPMRPFAYLDNPTARMFGLTGLANLLAVVPDASTSTATVQRELLGIPAVTSAQATRTTTSGTRESLQELLGILRVTAAITLLLAPLIAFNTASMGRDERSREHAATLAFGLPTRTVLGMAVTESSLIGIVTAGPGVVGGYVLLAWLNATSVADVLPEIGVTTSLATSTLVLAAGLGVLTVALAPLLSARKLRRLDIPSTLRVVE